MKKTSLVLALILSTGLSGLTGCSSTPDKKRMSMSNLKYSAELRADRAGLKKELKDAKDSLWLIEKGYQGPRLHMVGDTRPLAGSNTMIISDNGNNIEAGSRAFYRKTIDPISHKTYERVGINDFVMECNGVGFQVSTGVVLADGKVEYRIGERTGKTVMGTFRGSDGYVLHGYYGIPKFLVPGSADVKEFVLRTNPWSGSQTKYANLYELNAFIKALPTGACTAAKKAWSNIPMQDGYSLEVVDYSTRDKVDAHKKKLVDDAKTRLNNAQAAYDKAIADYINEGKMKYEVY